MNIYHIIYTRLWKQYKKNKIDINNLSINSIFRICKMCNFNTTFTIFLIDMYYRARTFLYYYPAYVISVVWNFQFKKILYLLEVIINGFSITDSKSTVLSDACSIYTKNEGGQLFSFFYIIPDKNKKDKTHYLICTKINSNVTYKDLTIIEKRELFDIISLLSIVYNRSKIVINIEKPYSEIDSFHAHFISNNVFKTIPKNNYESDKSLSELDDETDEEEME